MTEAGHEPNGEFWAGVVEFKAAKLADRLDMDPEADSFLATGTLADITALQELLEPYLQDPSLIPQLLAEAAQAGFEFED